MNRLAYMIPAFALLLGACSEKEIIEANSPLTLEVKLAVPAEESFGSRTLGDPGIEEEFLAPTHLWVFLAADTKHSQLVYATHFTTAESAWTLSADGRVYQYNDRRILTFDGLDLYEKPEIRAYLVASHEPISFTGASLIDPSEDGQVAVQTITEEQLTRLCFNVRYGTKGNMKYINLRDVYSTPYNLSSSWGDTNKGGGEYYGTVPQDYFVASVISVVDTLYHVASKIDFQWTAATSNAQPNVAKSIVLEQLPATGYVFRPTENATGISFTETYKKALLGAASADDTSCSVSLTPGNQWNGRAYTYVLQPGNDILHYNFTTKNNAPSGGYQGVANPSDVVRSEMSEVFASWYKVNLRIEDSTVE